MKPRFYNKRNGYIRKDSLLVADEKDPFMNGVSTQVCG